LLAGGSVLWLGGQKQPDGDAAATARTAQSTDSPGRDAVPELGMEGAAPTPAPVLEAVTDQPIAEPSGPPSGTPDYATVFGRIRDADGQPVGEMQVEVWGNVGSG